MKRKLLLLLAWVLLLSGCAEKPEAREADVIIRELIGVYADDPAADTDALLTELEAADGEKAQQWKQIMDFWRTQDSTPVSLEALPSSLPNDDSLCLVVLGFELNSDGTMQEELLGRLQVALHCAEQYPNAYVLCTGGGTAFNAPEVTEAGLMGQWLLEHGLAEERLIVEEHSRSTVENALYSLGMLRSHSPSVRSLAIISSSYHIVWGSVLFESVLVLRQNGDEDGIHVIANAAYPFLNERYSDSRSFLRSQLLSLVS